MTKLIKLAKMAGDLHEADHAYSIQSTHATPTHMISAVPKHILSCPFSEKSSELPFQNFEITRKQIFKN